LEGLGLIGRLVLIWIPKKYCVSEWNGFIWLRVITSGTLL